MSNIIYKTGAELRAENQQLHPELFIRNTCGLKYFFRGEPVSRLLKGRAYQIFLETVRISDVKTAYKKAQRWIAAKREKMEAQYDRQLFYF